MMLSDEHFDKLRGFRVRAMADKLREIVDDSAYDAMTFEEKVALMIDAEDEARINRKIAKLNKEARFKMTDACMEDIIYLPERRISKDRMKRYAACEWIAGHDNVVIVSKTGGGKSFMVQAMGNAACRLQYTVRYCRLSDICRSLNIARTDGTYYETFDGYCNVDLLIIDDFFTTPIGEINVIDLFEILESREGRASTLFASQLDPAEWYLRIEAEVIADSILNRIAKRARFIDIEGPNMREYLQEQRQKDNGYWE